jgi:hypothetical protein
MKKRSYNRGMGKDDSRGARSGRNVRLTVMISEGSLARLEAEKLARSEGVKKATASEIVDGLLAALPEPKKKR